MKTNVNQLAALGGVPLFETPLHVGAPNLIDPAAIAADLQAVLQSGYLTNNGPRVREFEARITDITQTRHCIATCNATIALQIAARAMNLTGEVIMPSFTFIATAHAMEWIGLTPVFADVDPRTHTMCPESAARCVTSRTSALLPVHLWGYGCHTEALQQLATQHGLMLLYDASHAFSCSHQGKSIGGFGAAEVFSFHATKFAHSAEGGAIVTNDDELAERCRRLRSFGFTGLTEVSDVGTNGKMNELCAAVGLRSLLSLNELQGRNHENRGLYTGLLQRIRGLQLFGSDRAATGNSQYLVVSVEPDFGLSRDELVQLLRADGITARAYFNPGCHRSQPYLQHAVHHPVALPVTEQLSETILQLPTNSNVSADDIHSVCEFLAFVQGNVADIRRLLDLRNGRMIGHEQDPAVEPLTVRKAG